MLNVTVEVPPTAMLVGKKALLMVGGLATVSVAVLLVVPVPPLVDVMVPLVLAFDPPVVLFTSTAMVHEPLADAGESQVVMSDFHYERATCVEVVERAHGDVLVAGLGLGMILHPILGKESVRSVTVIEKYQDVVDLVLPTLPASEKLTVLLDDIYTWKPPQAHSYDVIWFDIWPDIEVNRLSEMARLHRRFWRYLNRTNPECWMESWHRQETQRIARRRRIAKKDNPQSPLLQAAESA